MARQVSHEGDYEGQVGGEAQEEQYEEGGRKLPIKLIVIIVGVIALLFTVVFVYMSLTKDKTPAEPQPGDPGYVEPSVDPETGEGTPNLDDLFGEDPTDQEEPFSYTAEEIESLRAWGYTGGEIEQSELDMIPAEELISDSKAAQEKAREELNNPESDAYKALMNTTWLGQELRPVPTYVEGMDLDFYYDVVTYNADYEKVEPRGTNLMLKVELKNGDYHFMECSLLRYLQLPEKGNIVITYRTITYNDYTIIFDMQEKDVGDRP